VVTTDLYQTDKIKTDPNDNKFLAYALEVKADYSDRIFSVLVCCGKMPSDQNCLIYTAIYHARRKLNN
jgi:hypothetical protein